MTQAGRYSSGFRKAIALRSATWPLEKPQPIWGDSPCFWAVARSDR